MSEPLFRVLGQHDYPRRAVYKYRVANASRFRPYLNRYGWRVIGAGVVLGDWACCVKWTTA